MKYLQVLLFCEGEMSELSSTIEPQYCHLINSDKICNQQYLHWIFRVLPTLDLNPCEINN